MTTVNIFRRIRTPDKGLEKVQDGVGNFAQQVVNKFKEIAEAFTTAALTATTGTITTLTSTTATATMLRLTTGTAITSGGTNVDVTGKSVLFCDTSGGSFTITNFKGGVDGQVVKVIKVTDSNNLSFSLGNSSSGGQQLLHVGGGTLTLTGVYGGVEFVYRESDSSWYHTGDT